MSTKHELDAKMNISVKITLKMFVACSQTNGTNRERQLELKKIVLQAARLASWKVYTVMLIVSWPICVDKPPILSGISNMLQDNESRPMVSSSSEATSNTGVATQRVTWSVRIT